MRKVFLLSNIVIFCLFLTGVYVVFAQDETVSGTQQSEVTSQVEQEETISDTNWKQELDSDKQQIQEQRQEISQNAQAARAEEVNLREQIKAAIDSGDMQTAEQLKEQLRSVHQENLQEKIQDKQKMQAAKQDLKNDVKESRQEGFMPLKKDQDSNPPGSKGGPGTNWENKPGPQGGSGAGPDRKLKIGNPPGPKGGPGAGPRKPQGGARGKK